MQNGFDKNKVHIEEDKVICVLERAECRDDEWKDYEEKVKSEMDHFQAPGPQVPRPGPEYTTDVVSTTLSTPAIPASSSSCADM